MHPRLICAALLLSVTSAHASTNVTLFFSGTNTANAGYTVPTNATAQVMWASVGPSQLASMYISVGPAGIAFGKDELRTNSRLPCVVGPAQIYIGGNASDQGLCTIQVSTTAEYLAPSTGVVIPSDATGPVNIILESSCDMVNWTLANPGTYGSSATNRFFRVRALRL